VHAAESAANKFKGRKNEVDVTTARMQEMPKPITE